MASLSWQRRRQTAPKIRVEYPEGAFHRSLKGISKRYATAVAVAVDFEVAVAVQIPVERAVSAVPGADKVLRLFERSEVERV
jgi:hypothetical protein